MPLRGLPAAADPPVAALLAAEPAPEASAVDLGGQSHCGVVAGIDAMVVGPEAVTPGAPVSKPVVTRRVYHRLPGDIGTQFRTHP